MASPPIASAADGIRVVRAGTGDSGAIAGRRWPGWIVESLFVVLFPSDCRTCGVPPVTVSRLPVCQECRDSMQAIADGVCTIWVATVARTLKISTQHVKVRHGDDAEMSETAEANVVPMAKAAGI